MTELSIDKISFDLREFLPKTYINFDMNDIEKDINILPPHPAVYCFYDNEGRLAYVGKSKDLRKRIYQHLSSCHNKGLEADIHNGFIDGLSVYFCKDELNAIILERFFIQSDVMCGYHNIQFTKNPVIREELPSTFKEKRLLNVVQEEEKEPKRIERLIEELPTVFSEFPTPNYLKEKEDPDEVALYKDTLKRFMEIDKKANEYRTTEEKIKHRIFNITYHANSEKHGYSAMVFVYILLEIMKINKGNGIVLWKDTLMDYVVGSDLKRDIRWFLSTKRKYLLHIIPNLNIQKCPKYYRIGYDIPELFEKAYSLDKVSFEKARDSFWDNLDTCKTLEREVIRKHYTEDFLENAFQYLEELHNKVATA